MLVLFIAAEATFAAIDIAIAFTADLAATLATQTGENEKEDQENVRAKLDRCIQVFIRVALATPLFIRCNVK